MFMSYVCIFLRLKGFLYVTPLDTWRALCLHCMQISATDVFLVVEDDEDGHCVIIIMLLWSTIVCHNATAALYY